MGKRIKQQGELWIIINARNDMEEEVYSKLEEDGAKKMIYELARGKDENGKDVKGWRVG